MHDYKINLVLKDAESKRSKELETVSAHNVDCPPTHSTVGLLLRKPGVMTELVSFAYYVGYPLILR